MRCQAEIHANEEYYICGRCDNNEVEPLFPSLFGACPNEPTTKVNLKQVEHIKLVSEVVYEAKPIQHILQAKANHKALRFSQHYY